MYEYTYIPVRRLLEVKACFPQSQDSNRLYQDAHHLHQHRHPWFTRDTFYKSCKFGNEAALLCVIAQLRNLEEKRSSSVLHCNNILRSIFTICFASNTDLTEFWVIYIVRTGFHIIWFDSDANLVVRLISETVL